MTEPANTPEKVGCSLTKVPGENYIMLLRAALILLLGISGSGHLNAQSVEQWMSWGDASMEQGEYYGASRFYEGALSVDPGRMVLQWKQAEACRLSNQYGKATELYDRVFRKDMGRTYPDALRWLGEMQLCDGRYDDAQRTWQRVLDKERDKGSVTAQRARNALLGCAMALDTTGMANVPELEHIQPPINTYDSEFGARIGPDQALYFTSLRGELKANEEVKDTTSYRTAMFRARMDGGDPTAPEALPPAINGTGENGNAAWTPDGRWILFTRCEKGSPCQIHIAEVLADGYGEAIPLPGLGENLPATQPMIARFEGHEAPLLLFASDREGGVGGMDIWQARLVDGAAVDVHPLPPPVNSPGNERCPWYDSRSGTLWFSSDHHPGFGGFDIFHSTFANDVFGPVMNSGRPLNSPANDLYPSFDIARDEGWLTSNRIGSFAAKGATCCNDLYRFKRSTATIMAGTVEKEAKRDTQLVRSGTVELRMIADQLPLKLYFHNDDPDPRTRSRTTIQDYATTYRRYRSLMPAYLSQGDAGELTRFFSDEVDKGYLDLAELTIALRRTLERGTSVSLDVKGHASPLALNDYNQRLSERRIESLRNHLMRVDGAALAPYLGSVAANGAVLHLRPLPFGEEASMPGISDELTDLEHSVYSVSASRERRIEIVAIRIDPSDSPTIERTLRKELGELRQDEQRVIPFLLENQGEQPMLILDVKADCGCTTADIRTDRIMPGGSLTVDLVFNGRAPFGPLERSVIIRTNGSPEMFRLVIEGTIVP